MFRTTALLATTVTAAGLLLAPPAYADAGCAEAFAGPRTCVFTLGPDDDGIRITLRADAGSDPVLAIARADRLVDPLTGEPVRHPVTGQEYHQAQAGCLTSGGGYCETTTEVLVDLGPASDRTVTCELSAADGGSISGTWSCEPIRR